MDGGRGEQKLSSIIVENDVLAARGSREECLAQVLMRAGEVD
jgi:hypothetical protein